LAAADRESAGRPSVPAVPWERADTLQLYLREIGQVNLLTPKEEVALAKRIKKATEPRAST
jgi:DNA-directed RNA polymerase sigma subunit (sigma70/sigma32)